MLYDIHILCRQFLQLETKTMRYKHFSLVIGNDGFEIIQKNHFGSGNTEQSSTESLQI